MRRLAAVAALAVLASCAPPETDVLVTVAAPPVTAGPDALAWSAIPSTTTTEPRPVRATAAAAPVVVSVGECSGWLDLIASLWPADEVPRACEVLACESHGNPNAVSRTNDHGLFQINAVHAGSFDWANRYDPTTNAAYARQLWASSGWQPWTCAR
jgi:hypothetical protein